MREDGSGARRGVNSSVSEKTLRGTQSATSERRGIPEVMASTGSIRKHLSDNPSNFDPRKFLKESTAGMKEICKARYEAFGCAGNASKITPISLEKMVDFYK